VRLTDSETVTADQVASNYCLKAAVTEVLHLHSSFNLLHSPKFPEFCTEKLWNHGNDKTLEIPKLQPLIQMQWQRPGQT